MRNKINKTVKKIEPAKLKRAKKNYHEIMKTLTPYLKDKKTSRIIKHSHWNIVSNFLIIQQSEQETELS